MKTFVGLILALGAGAILALAAPHARAAEKPCARTTFKTKAIKTACKTGQKKAKSVMRAFLKKNKGKNGVENCLSCHSKLGPKYPLKKGGLTKYKALGGK